MSNIPASPSLNTQLANAVAEIARAQDRHAQLQRLAAEARHEEAAALKKVNEAQSHFDALVAEVKKSAPRDSGWRREPGFPAEA